MLYHAFGIPKAYRYVRTEYQSKEFVGHGQRERQVRMVPIGLKPGWLKAEVPRYRCQGCGQTWEVSPPLSGPMSTSADSSNAM